MDQHYLCIPNIWQFSHLCILPYRLLAHQKPVAREGQALGRALVGQVALVDAPERPREGSLMRALDNRWKHIRLYFLRVCSFNRYAPSDTDDACAC